MASPLSFELFPVNLALRPDSVTETHLLVRIRADRGAGGRPRPRLTTVLILDASGSMRGEPIAQVIQSAQRLSEILADDDRLGVVMFNDGAETISPLRELAQGRREIKQELAAIEADGGTNISGALAHAALLFPRRAPGERQLALLLSDGEPNVGAKTPRDLAAQASLLKDREIAVSTLGYGSSHNDDILVAIAEGGGGRYAFVVDPKLAQSSFVRTLGAQLDVVAEQIHLVLTPSEGIEILRVLDEPPTSFGAGGMRVTLPDMIVGDELNVVFELKARAPREVGPWRPIVVALGGQVAGTTEAFKLTGSPDLLVTRTGELATDTTAQAAVSIARAAELRVEARRHAERGGYAEATAVLQKAQALLQATPGFTAGAEGPLNDAFETIADELLVMKRAPRAEEYQKYKKASRDYLDFAQSGARQRSGGKLSETPPASRVLLEHAMRATSLPKAFLHVVAGPLAGTRMPLLKDRFVIGRARQTSDLFLEDANVSRQHSMVEFVGGAFWLVDMGSTRGPMVNGERVDRWRLSPGDTFDIVDTRIRYEED